MTKRIKKGVWLHFIASLAGKRGIDDFVDRYADAGFDLLIPCVKNVDGLLDYHSKIGFVRDEFKTWDPLEHLTRRANHRGIKVHAWFCNNPEGPKGKLLSEHPEYAAMTPEGEKAKCHSGFFTCLARPQVIDYAHSIMAEVAQNYGVDGIHLDYIRTGEHACFCKICRTEFKKRMGIDISGAKWSHFADPRWYNWRIANVTRLVSRISSTCRKKKKELSAAVYNDYPASMYTQSQDFPMWSEKGYLDLAVPMNYTPDSAMMMSYARNHAANMRGKAELWEGLGYFMLKKIGKLTEQISLLKDFGVKGVCLFEHHNISDSDLRALSKT